MKLREGNVFTPVSQSFCKRGEVGVCFPGSNGAGRDWCVSQHAIGQAEGVVCIPACNGEGRGLVCIPACNWVGGVKQAVRILL